MGTTNYLGNALLNEIFRATDFSPPSTVYISLHTADPGDSGANEVTLAAWPAYTREDAAQGGAATAAWNAPTTKQISNLIELPYPVMDGAGTVTVTHYGIWDAATGGNCLHYGAFDEAKTIGTLDEYVIKIGQIDVDHT